MPDKTHQRETRIIQSAWLDNPDLPDNTRKYSSTAATIWLFVGVLILICDGLALAHFSNDYVESIILGILTMPSGAFVILCALEARK